MLLYALAFRQAFRVCDVLLCEFSDCVGRCRCLFDSRATIWTCFAAVFGAPEPFAETAVAVGVAAGEGEGLVEEAEADLAGDDGAEVVEEGGQGGRCLGSVSGR